MSVRIYISPALYHIDGSQYLIESGGNTIGECLEQLVIQFPQIKKVLFDKNGELLSHLDVYLNGVSAYPDQLAKPVKDGDELLVISIITGG